MFSLEGASLLRGWLIRRTRAISVIRNEVDDWRRPLRVVNGDDDKAYQAAVADPFIAALHEAFTASPDKWVSTARVKEVFAAIDDSLAQYGVSGCVVASESSPDYGNRLVPLIAQHLRIAFPSTQPKSCKVD